LYNLAKYPQIQQKAFEEIQSVMGDDAGKEITMNDLNELHYLELVIKESLRLFPPVPFIGRVMVEEIALSKRHFIHFR
jgi:cytochrome P450 family 4